MVQPVDEGEGDWSVADHGVELALSEELIARLSEHVRLSHDWHGERWHRVDADGDRRWPRERQHVPGLDTDLEGRRPDATARAAALAICRS